MDVLLESRNEAGRFPAGSIGFWYNDFWKYVTLIWETILMALTATLLATGLAVILSFLAARNTTPHPMVGAIARRFLEFCRGVPEILFALVLVFWVGIGPLAGVLAITIHAAGALGKLFFRSGRECVDAPCGRHESRGRIVVRADALRHSAAGSAEFHILRAVAVRDQCPRVCRCRLCRRRRDRDGVEPHDQLLLG